MKKSTTKQTQKTAGEQVYEYLRNGIIEIRLKPGQMVSIKELSEHLSVSRSPIRDALIRLENEGLITSMPQRGTLISKIDPIRANDERFLRICVEEKIAALFMSICTEADLLYLEDNITKQRGCEKNTDVRDFLKLDDAFHSYFYKQMGKEFCFNLLQNNVGHYNRIRLLSCMEENMLAKSIVQHEEIVGLIREKNKEKLQEAIKIHLQKIEQDEVELKCKYPSLFVQASKLSENEKPIWSTDFLNSIVR